MTLRDRLRPLAIGACLLVVVIAACRQTVEEPVPVVSVDARLTEELSRLETTLGGIDRAQLPEAIAGMLDQSPEMIAKARDAKSDIARLYRLQDAFLRVETFAWMASHADSGASVGALTTLWTDTDAAIRLAADCTDPEVIYRGLCQAAANRREKLYEASLPYGKVSEAPAGLYYLSEAVANARFAKLVASLSPRAGMTTETRPGAAAIENAWNAVNEETIAFFETDPTGRTAIPVSVKLKESRELLDSGFEDGALVRLLEARLELSRRKAGDAAVSMPDSTPAAGKGSVAALLDALASDDDASRVALVRRDVAPLYLSLFDAVETTEAAVASTTVTLVRWPYT